MRHMSSSSTLTVDAEQVPRGSEKPIPTLDNSYGPTKDLFFLPIPVSLQYHPGKTFRFSIWMNCGISLAATFLISNMYYCQPLLIQMADTFDVSYEGVAKAGCGWRSS
ncbi:hypothetical protein GALMADRAFT_245677 [Galerina marginata CBS 339.88]|uniref:Uncharacterized protein n=1 Tax=Galerina marginata (strain CBS 339.88) TaxID=685588 RepID=A0A067T5B9_GALM3|nr:hypothetical protein GALMADRAFT_245677 [Galerina marginata CBS 339.88]